MDTNDSSSIYKALKKHIENKNSQKVFNPIVNELVEIFYLHYTIVENINKVLEVSVDEFLNNELDSVKKDLLNSVEKILCLIEKISNRKILIFITCNGSKVYNISKTYNANLKEIFELNNITDIFPSTQKKIFLIPVKTF